MILTEERKALYLKVVKLMKKGLLQSEATKQMGVNLGSFRAWLYKSDKKALYLENTRVFRREAIYLKVVELSKTGLTQKQATEQVGVNYHSFLSWLHKDDNIKLFAVRACKFCGKNIDRTKKLTNRKYCSASCQAKAKYRQKNPNAQEQRAHKPEIRQRAIAMYRSGVEGVVIARCFDIPAGTVYNWIHKSKRRSE